MRLSSWFLLLVPAGVAAAVACSSSASTLSPCQSLASCCAMLSGSEATECYAEVGVGDSTSCASTLSSATLAGACGGSSPTTATKDGVLCSALRCSEGCCSGWVCSVTDACIYPEPEPTPVGGSGSGSGGGDVDDAGDLSSGDDGGEREDGDDGDDGGGSGSDDAGGGGDYGAECVALADHVCACISCSGSDFTQYEEQCSIETQQWIDCMMNADCSDIGGACDQPVSGDGGVCTAEGVSCSSDGDCCDGTCASAGYCCSDASRSTGASCQDDLDCCTSCDTSTMMCD